MRTCWDPCLGETFTVHVFELENLKTKIEACKKCGHDREAVSFGASLSFDDEEIRRTSVIFTDDPVGACLRIVNGVPCDAQHRRAFLRDIPLAVGGPGVWRGGSNVLVVAECDEALDQAERSSFLGVAAVAQNAMFTSTYIPEFDLSLPLVTRTETAPAPRQEKIYGPQKYLLTFKGTAYAERHPKDPRRPSRKLGQHRTALKALHDPARGVVVVLRCEPREVHLFPKEVDCAAWQAEYDSYDYVDLLNTTFALVPGGRSPGTFRLSEAMSAGAIPVFVDQFSPQTSSSSSRSSRSGGTVSNISSSSSMGGIFVRPFDGAMISWERMSVRVHVSEAVAATSKIKHHGNSEDVVADGNDGEAAAAAAAAAGDQASKLVKSLERWSREDVVAARVMVLEASESILKHSDAKVLEVYERRLSRGSAL